MMPSSPLTKILYESFQKQGALFRSPHNKDCSILGPWGLFKGPAFLETAICSLYHLLIRSLQLNKELPVETIAYGLLQGQRGPQGLLGYLDPDVSRAPHRGVILRQPEVLGKSFHLGVPSAAFLA